MDLSGLKAVPRGKQNPEIRHESNPQPLAARTRRRLNPQLFPFDRARPVIPKIL